MAQAHESKPARAADSLACLGGVAVPWCRLGLAPGAVEQDSELVLGQVEPLVGRPAQVELGLLIILRQPGGPLEVTQPLGSSRRGDNRPSEVHIVSGV